MAFKFFDFFHRIVVEDAQSHIVTGGQEPLFAADEFGTSDGQFGNFKGFDTATGFVIPNHHVSRIQGRQDPWLGVVQIDGFHAFRRGGEFLFYI
jgi:hypothetical protein